MVLMIQRSLSVIIVCNDMKNKNDGLNLYETVSDVQRALLLTLDHYEIILVVNGCSTDEYSIYSEKILNENPDIRLINNSEKLALHACIKKGNEVSRHAYTVYIPADNTWNYNSFITLFSNIGKADVVTTFSTNLRSGMSSYAAAVSIAYVFILNFLFLLRVHYFNGLTIYPASYIKTENFVSSGFGFQAEALIRAIKKGFSFIEVPATVNRKNLHPSGGVHLNNIIDSTRMIVLLFNSLNIRNLLSHMNSNEQMPINEIISEASISQTKKNILLTGASSGIGAILCDHLARQGHEIFACSRRVDLIKKKNDLFSNVHSIKCDVSDEKEVLALFDEINTRTISLDVVINCAGAFGAIGPFDKTNSDDWINTIKTNLFGTYLISKYSVSFLKNGNCPKIINFSGGGAFTTFTNYTAYACSKAAIVRLTECMAEELACHNISVNAIAPGIMSTNVHNETIDAGEEKAGKVAYYRAKLLMGSQLKSSDNLTKFVDFLILESRELTGKTISVNFDPWLTEAFKKNESDITRSDLYTMRRVNVSNLPPGNLRNLLTNAWKDFRANG